MTKRMLSSLALVAILAGGTVAPARADGGASTRNILLGGAAIGGALLIINHNKQVHQKYADDARAQAETANQRDDAQAAYSSEKTAYEREAVLVADYQHEVALQHKQILALRTQVANADARASKSHAAYVAATRANAPAAAAPSRAVAAAPSDARPLRIASTSYGWGQF